MPQPALNHRPGERQEQSRLFFALVPDAATREAIHKASRAAVSLSDGRPVPAQNLHITLAFLGHIGEAAVREALNAAAEVQGPVFSFDLDEIGYWASSQVLWYGCSATPSKLRDLALSLRQRLTARGLKPDPDKFVPHVTLSRWVRKLGQFGPAEKIRWNVQEFTLVRSVTRAGGVDYTPLEQWPLGRQGVLI
ncbi:MAG: RNA 2',3'-cyclic phosphodiesterase [Bacillota bacterium]